MTILAALGDAFNQMDRVLAGRRGGLLGGLLGSGIGPLTMPVPVNQPITLSGDDRLVTYADTVASYPVVFGVWSKLVRNLATTDIGIFRRDEFGEVGERVHGSALEELLREPAPGKGLISLLQWLFNPYFVEGNGLIGKARENGRDKPPTHLIPLDWRYMSAWARPGGPVEAWVSYQLGEPRLLGPEDVVHLAWDAPTGGAIGPSPLRALGTAIRLDDAAARMQAKSFDNGARPSGALVFPKDVRTTADERAEMRDDVRRLHEGIDKAFRVAVLSGGVEWKTMSFSAVEAELLGTRQRSMDEVCIAYDVRRSVIAEPDGNTAGRAQAEILKDFQRTLRPHHGLLEEVVQRQLIDPEPEWREERLCMRFTRADAVPGTWREEVETAVHAYTNGLASLDESRERLGWEPIGTSESRLPRVPHAQLAPGRDGRTLPPSDQTDPSRSTRPVPEA